MSARSDMTGSGSFRALMRDVERRVGAEAVITKPGRLLPYESDALPRFRETPAASMRAKVPTTEMGMAVAMATG